MSARNKACAHKGPYRVVQAVLPDHRGLIVVFCQGCGGYQEPYWIENPLRRASPIAGGHIRPTDMWFGTAPDFSTFSFPEGCALLVRSKPIADHDLAHALGTKLRRDLATQRKDGSWFVGMGEHPPWWETKRDPSSGDILYRERAEWTPPPPIVDPEDVWA